MSDPAIPDGRALEAYLEHGPMIASIFCSRCNRPRKPDEIGRLVTSSMGPLYHCHEWFSGDRYAVRYRRSIDPTEWVSARNGVPISEQTLEEARQYLENTRAKMAAAGQLKGRRTAMAATRFVLLADLGEDANVDSWCKIHGNLGDCLPFLRRIIAAKPRLRKYGFPGGV